MIVPIILMSLGGVSLFFFLFEKVKAYYIKVVCIKAITSLLFIALGFYGFFVTSFNYLALFICCGLICGLAGDIFLDLKYVYRENDFGWTLAGFIAFGVGHIFYITGMWLHFYQGQNVLYIIIPLIIGLVIGVGTILTEKILKTNYGKLKIPGLCYAILLFSMVTTAFSVWMMTGFNNRALLLIFIGGILFAVSDLILNMTYFGEGHEKPFDLISNSITYYAAQFLIALAVLFIL